MHRRLFSDRDFQLFEEKGNYEEQRRRLDLRRKESIEEILAAEDILIDHAGHFALVTHREEFLRALMKYVRPLAMNLQLSSSRQADL